MTHPTPDLNDFGAWIPRTFREEVAGRAPEPHVDGDTWLAELPRLAQRMADEWGLVATGPVHHGVCAVVIPVQRDGEPAALKLGWPHRESDHEHLALRAWNGRGAVQLLAADPRRGALLLEALDADTDLTNEPLIDACGIVGALMRELDHDPLPQTRDVVTEAERWLDQLAAHPPGVPRRMTEQATSMLRDLATQRDGWRLVHEDLHFENVLAGRRAPWLAIDPKPITAPWEFAVAPVLWNRTDELARAHNPRTHLRFRLDLVCDAGGLDESLARAWTFVRVVLNAVWACDELPGSHDFISRMLVLAKAMND